MILLAIIDFKYVCLPGNIIDLSKIYYIINKRQI